MLKTFFWKRKWYIILISHFYGVTLYKYHILYGWHCRLSPRGSLSTEAEPRLTMISEGWQSTMSSGYECYIYSIILNVNFYNKFHRRETLLYDIQNCHPANWPIRLLEINMRYNNVDCHPRKHCQPKRSRAEVDNVSSGWQSTMSPVLRKMLYLFYYTESHFYNKFHRLRHCRVIWKIVTRPIDQSDCWKLTWGIIIIIEIIVHWKCNKNV